MRYRFATCHVGTTARTRIEYRLDAEGWLRPVLEQTVYRGACDWAG